MALQEGEEVIRVPLSSMINIEHALMDPELGPVLESSPWLPDHLAMSLYLHLLRQGGSRHRGYLDWLPNSSHSPLIWDVADMKLLRGTSILREVFNRRAYALDLLERLQRAFDPSFLNGFGPLEMFWGLGVLRSREFGVDVQDREGVWHRTHSLVPLADALNTAREPNTECWTNPTSTHFICAARQIILPGSELTAQYGTSLTNREYLLDYGFTSPEFSHLPLPVDLTFLNGTRVTISSIKDLGLNLSSAVELLQSAKAQVRDYATDLTEDLDHVNRATSSIRMSFASEIRKGERSTLHKLIADLEEMLDPGRTRPDDADL